MAVVIEADDLGKRYRLGEGGYATLREHVSRAFGRRQRMNAEREVWALRDVCLSVEEGSVVGIVGRNGAGKTTLLKTVARIVRPTTGVVRVRGRVGALLEVGTGFHPELTGRENVYLNGVVLGMTRREVSRRFADIVEFSGVEPFLDTPLKRYSSGMHMRLAFAVAAHIDPDVLIVDEVLAVGDAEFRERCLGRMSDIAREGRTVLFVSHDSGAVAQLCTRAVWLDEGRVRADGSVDEILDLYRRRGLHGGGGRVDVPVRADSQLVRLSLAVLDASHEPVDAPRRDQPIVFEILFEAAQPLRAIDASIFLIDRAGARILNENLSDSAATITGAAGSYRLRFTLPAILGAGDYAVGLWLGNARQLVFLDEVMTLTVRPLAEDREALQHGSVRPAVTWSVDRVEGSGSTG